LGGFGYYAISLKETLAFVTTAIAGLVAASRNPLAQWKLRRNIPVNFFGYELSRDALSQ